MRIKPFSTVASMFFALQPTGNQKDPEDKRPTRGWYAPIEGSDDTVIQHCNGIQAKVLHVAVCTDDDKPMYDQIVMYEGVGAITVCVLPGIMPRIGLVEVDRPIIKDMKQYSYSEIDVSTLGRKSWEVPRGMPKKWESPEQTASRQAGEELGTSSMVTHQCKLGEFSPNSTFFPVLQPVFLIEFDESRIADKSNYSDPTEKIHRVVWKNLVEIKQMILSGDITCGMTLAALSMYNAYMDEVNIPRG